jgi:ribosomal protein L4
MPTVAIKTKGGGTAGELTLSERIFGAPRNLPLMHQAVRTELENSRQDTRNVPGRGDMLGGGRKPYRQKGPAEHDRVPLSHRTTVRVARRTVPIRVIWDLHCRRRCAVARSGPHCPRSSRMANW